jgi:hypothetical protein
MPLRSILLITIALFVCSITGSLTSCATPGDLTGGDKDTAAPQLIQAIPSPFETNYQGKSATLRFSEFITLKNASQQISLSPPLQQKPTINAVGSKLTLTWEEDLLPNRTYTISLGNAVVDLTEGNAAKNLKLVFSTGPDLDSGQLSGFVYLAETQEPAKGFAVVLLAPDSLPADPSLFRPAYSTTTNDQGFFHLNFLKEGSYWCLAFPDKDQNLKPIPGTEPVAFGQEPIDIAQPDTLALPASTERFPPKFRGIRYRGYGKVDAFFSAPPQVTIQLAGPNDPPLYIHPTPSGDTLELWFNPAGKDSLTFLVNGTQPDTTYQQTLPLRSIKKDKLEITLPKGPFHPRDTLWMTTNQPLVGFPTSEQPIYASDSSTVFVRPVPNKARTYQMVMNHRFDYTRNVVLPPGTLTDLFGQTHDTLRWEVKSPAAEAYAYLKLTVECPGDGAHLFEIMTEKGQVIQTHPFVGTVLKLSLANMVPGKYRFRIVDDENANGRWDPGSFVEKKWPEPIWIHPQTLQLRANWEVEERIVKPLKSNEP